MTYNTIIWDMDGTVLNTLYDLKTSMNYTLEMFNLRPHTIEEYRHAFGNGVRYAFEEVVGDDIPTELYEKFFKECVSVLWGFRDKDFLVESGATEFADSPKDILKIIDGL